LKIMAEQVHPGYASAAQAVESILYHFGGTATDGGNPHGSLTLSGSTLYGMTNGCSGGECYSKGTIFQINTNGSGYKVLHAFGGGTDGNNPRGSLALSGASLYGMTSATIFRINTDGTGYKVLRYTGVAGNSLIVSGSTLYGTDFGGPFGQGRIFRMNTDGSGYVVLRAFNNPIDNDGWYPADSLTLSGSTLYGMSVYGGSGSCSDGGGNTVGCGTIFQISTDGKGYKVLHNFTGYADGYWPYGSLRFFGSTLYGMTSRSDSLGGAGTLFSFDTAASEFTPLHNFGPGSGSYDGSMPYGSLTLSGSTLYGMTSGSDPDGFPDSCGTIFSFDAASNKLTLLYSFACSSSPNWPGTTDGAWPRGSLALTGSRLYGMTENGGGGDCRQGCGTVFSLLLNPLLGSSASSTVLTTSVNPSVSGQSVNFTATVRPAGGGPGTPTGGATFRDGSTSLGTATLDSSGAANLILSTLTTGTHSITAVYGGDPGFAASTSTTMTQVVNRSATSTAPASSVNPSVSGQTVTFTATVRPAGGGSGTPTGNVVFRDGSVSLGSAVLNTSGVANLVIPTLTTGSHSITAGYGGDTNFTASTSGIVTQVVTRSATGTALTSSVNPSASGQSVTFTATVRPARGGSGTPTGTVAFRDGSTVLGRSTLDGSGSATFTTSTLAVGSHSITAGITAR